MPKISVCMHTASNDNFLSEQGINSAVQMYVDCLNNQTFKDFEFILIDANYKYNKDAFKNIKTNFIFKHVPIHFDHLYWRNQNLVFISSAKNTGILYADGELLVTVDDAEIFPDFLLEKYWKYYSEKNIFMCAAHKRLKNIANESGRILFPINGETYINDSRLDGRVYLPMPTSWTYAGTSYSLKMALELNGFNEKMDGCKSLEDCEFGIRIGNNGGTFMYDPNAYFYILDHINNAEKPNYDTEMEQGFNPGTNNIGTVIVKENYGFCMVAQAMKIIKANISPVSINELHIINEATKKYRKFEINLADKDTQIWLNTPNFDLVKQRAELRSSLDWKW